MTRADWVSPSDDRSDPRLHVLLSAHTCEPGKGSEEAEGWNWVTQLSRWFRVSVITWSEHRAGIEAWRQANELPNVRFYYLDVPWPRRLIRYPPTFYFYYALWQLRAWLLARRILRTDPFQLVHHVTIGSLPGPIFMQFLPARFVFGPAGGGEQAPRSFWTGGGLQALVYEWLRAQRLRMLPWDPLFRSVLRRATRIVVTTPQSARLVPAQWQHKVVQMSTCGLEPAHVADVASRPASGQRVYTVGRFLHWKGFHLAIEAFARVARDFPGATLSILGDGPQRGRLERLAAARGLEDRVRFLGRVPRADVMRLRDESDIFLFCSLHDAGGTSVVEAMAGGKPVVCLDTGGPSLTVTAECGWKVPVTSQDEVVEGLARGMRLLLADPELRRRMGDAARVRVLAESVWERRADRMLAIYRAALTEPCLAAPTARGDASRAPGLEPTMSRHGR